MTRRAGALRALAAVAAILVLAAARPRGAVPSVSPDGKRIAFLADRDTTGMQLYVIGTDGRGERQLTGSFPEKGRPRWSADGRRIEFASFSLDSGRVFEVQPDGRDLHQVVAVPGRVPMLVDGGRRVMYSTGPWTEMQLSVSALDGSGLTPVSDGRGAVWNAAVSPDGRSIAYTFVDSTQLTQVWVMGADGSAPRALTRFGAKDGHAQCPAWAPDGRRVAFQVNAADSLDPRRGISDLWVADLDTGGLTKLPLRTGPWRDELPAWFPDGRRLAFQSDRTGVMQVWIAGLDGTGARQVTR